ncbi:MAG: dihydropteroate synthase, partial [Treponema sp.]|nr:dihydropteroate synthase [Treponema sp.]
NCGKLCSGQYKIMMALSRKTCIGEMTNQDVDKRLSGTLAANLISVINGASILRVHDVAETIDTMKVLSYVV